MKPTTNIRQLSNAHRLHRPSREHLAQDVPSMSVRSIIAISGHDDGAVDEAEIEVGEVGISMRV